MSVLIIWKDTLDSEMLSWIEGLIADYNEALNRIRRSRVTINNRSRQNDVNRILYSMGQESKYDSDSLYSVFAGIDDEYIAIVREAIINEKWHLMEREERYDFVKRHFPNADFYKYYDLLCNFRHGGFRLLGDIICDIDDKIEWVVLPVVSFDAYFGGTTFSKKILSKLPKDIIIRDRTSYGVSRYKVAEKLIYKELERRKIAKL